jgi:RNA polymerase sigma factor (sigma-70 family)
MTDLQLINNIKKNNCEKSLQELANRHVGICNKMIQKYCKICTNLGVSLDDLNTDKLLIVYRSAKSFKGDKKIKFSTWLGNQMRYHCLNTLNKSSKDISMENENIKYITEKNQNVNLSKENSMQERVDFINEILNQMCDYRTKKIFNLRYFSDTKLSPWNKIGKKMKISTQTAINIHNKAIDFLNKKINSKNLFDKI